VSRARDLWFELGATAAGCFAPLIVRSLVGTSRVTLQLRDLIERVRRREPFIGVMWHEDLLFYGYLFRGTGFTVLASRSRDGELGARVARGLGIRTVRGSSSRGGEDALHELIELARRGESVGFIADGPRGPRHVAKMGPIIAAKLSGRPIVPLACAMTRATRTRSWDRTRIPLPFGRIVCRAGELITVPPDASREECEQLRQRLQDELVEAESGAAAALSQDGAVHHGATGSAGRDR
jgi:lysophospholipid acyltransferase (LPLAT)-like uncharacterized protein